eukprot:1140722-Prorocentrum_minimum.AAC.1
MMPGMSGWGARDYDNNNRTRSKRLAVLTDPRVLRYEVCEEIRSRYSKLLPVIFLSAKCTEEDIVMVSNNGSKRKPISPAVGKLSTTDPRRSCFGLPSLVVLVGYLPPLSPPRLFSERAA